MQARIFNIMQYERHPESGEVLLLEDKIKEALQHKTITRYAYVMHDKDVYSAHDEEQNENHKKGLPKPRHWHIVLEFKNNAIEIGVVAKWFGIAENFVDVAKGRGAFLDCAQYLTHEDSKQQKLGKHRYEDSEIHANFDFRSELIKRAEQRMKYGKELSDKDELRNRVLFQGLTIRQLIAENPIAYQQDYATLDKFRLKYISERAPMPKTRMNYYVCGRGGVGKGLICKAIARSLYPNLKDDEDIYFEVGAKGAPFEGYDGQPVIIWNDRRAYDLLQELNGRGNVFNVFDTHPTRSRQNVKYSSVTLCNSVNIVNSVQDYKEFLDGLAGEYTSKGGEVQTAEDKGQSYRRFPFLLPLHEEDFDLLMNKGFYEGTREYEQYYEYKNIRGNMQRIAELCAGNEELARQLEAKTVGIVASKHKEVVERVEKPVHTLEEIEAYAKDLGVVESVNSVKIKEEDGPPLMKEAVTKA